MTRFLEIINPFSRVKSVYSPFGERECKQEGAKSFLLDSFIIRAYQTLDSLSTDCLECTTPRNVSGTKRFWFLFYFGLVRKSGHGHKAVVTILIMTSSSSSSYQTKKHRNGLRLHRRPDPRIP